MINFTTFLDFKILFLISIFIFFLFFFKGRKKLKYLTHERNILLQEKEATIGFIQNVGEVFADSETVETKSLATSFSEVSLIRTSLTSSMNFPFAVLTSGSLVAFS